MPSSSALPCHISIGKAYKTHIDYSPLGGWGVFASEEIPSGVVLETCPAILVRDSDYSDDSELGKYVFERKGDESLLALGNCSIYNHQKGKGKGKGRGGENIESDILLDKKMNRYMVQMKTTRRIKKGEEIAHDYGDDYWKD
jgi:SET domain-containing protein